MSLSEVVPNSSSAPAKAPSSSSPPSAVREQKAQHDRGKAGAWTRGVERLTCALAGGVGKPRFSHFLVSGVTFTAVVVGDAHPTWTLRTYGKNRTDPRSVEGTTARWRNPDLSARQMSFFLLYFCIFVSIQYKYLITTILSCGK